MALNPFINTGVRQLRDTGLAQQLALQRQQEAAAREARDNQQRRARVLMEQKNRDFLQSREGIPEQKIVGGGLSSADPVRNVTVGPQPTPKPQEVEAGLQQVVQQQEQAALQPPVQPLPPAEAQAINTDPNRQAATSEQFNPIQGLGGQIGAGLSSLIQGMSSPGEQFSGLADEIAAAVPQSVKGGFAAAGGTGQQPISTAPNLQQQPQGQAPQVPQPTLQALGNTPLGGGEDQINTEDPIQAMQGIFADQPQFVQGMLDQAELTQDYSTFIEFMKLRQEAINSELDRAQGDRHLAIELGEQRLRSLINATVTENQSVIANADDLLPLMKPGFFGGPSDLEQLATIG